MQTAPYTRGSKCTLSTLLPNKPSQLTALDTTLPGTPLFHSSFFLEPSPPAFRLTSIVPRLFISFVEKVEVKSVVVCADNEIVE